MMESVGSGDGARRVALDEQGRVADTALAPLPDGNEVAELSRLLAELLCAELSVLGARTVPTLTGHLGIVTMKERTAGSLEFWAGAALRPDPAPALRDAACDALLADWRGSVAVAGAARLVADGTCRSAVVLDDSGVTRFGQAHEIPQLGGLGVAPEAGARLAVRTAAGERAWDADCSGKPR